MLLELSIVTLNIWGIPFISLDRKTRIKAIADELAKGIYDVVSLQEVWSEKDYQLLKNGTEEVLPYSHYFYSGVVGSGLCLLSKYPIVSAFFHAWPVNGYIHRIHHGDWFGGKGVGQCRILVHEQPVNIYVAHLHAEYDNQNDEYKAHRIIQAFDTAQFIENTRNDAVLQILAGDLNIEPEDISYKLLLRTANLREVFQEFIGTNECISNSYTDKTAAEKNPRGKRIDHILIRAGQRQEAKIAEFKLPFSNRIPNKDVSYSDHEAIYARIKITARKENGSKSVVSSKYDGTYLHSADMLVESLEANREAARTKDFVYVDIYEKITALKECIQICNESLLELVHRQKIHFMMVCFFAFLLFAMIDLFPPYGLKTLFMILKFILSGFVIFFLFMATIWYVMEKHGILSGKLSMEIVLRNTENSRKNKV